MIGGMGGGSGHQHMAFEEFAGKLQSPATLRATQVRGSGRLWVCEWLQQPWHSRQQSLGGRCIMKGSWGVLLRGTC
jgi:hypothetical protein